MSEASEIKLPADDPRLDPELVENGDRRNVVDQYRGWSLDAIVEDLDEQGGTGLEIAIENLDHDFNIGSIVRTANAFGARHVHIVGAKRWNRRGAMVTDRYLHVHHHATTAEFLAEVGARGRTVIGIDNVGESKPLEAATLPENAVLVFGAEGPGLSPEMQQACQVILHITQYGSTRSINVGHAAAVAMWAWVTQNYKTGQK